MFGHLKENSKLKILYILIGGIGVFLLKEPILIGSFFCFNLILFLVVKSENKSYKFISKVKWFLLLVFLSSALVGENDLVLLKIKSLAIGINYEGAFHGAIRVAKVLTMLLITQTIRLTTSNQEFSAGLSGLGLSKSMANSINDIVEILFDEKKNKTKRKNKTKSNKGETSAIKVLLGKVGDVPKKIKTKIELAKERLGSQNDGVAESALAITLIRMVKIAPGLPLAPGHKNILIFPVFFYGISKAKTKLSGLKIGFISGVIHFLLGFGKYGPLGIFQYALLGVFFDLFSKITPTKFRLPFFMLVGIVGGLLRFSTELLLAWIMGLPKEFYFLYLPYMVSQMSFGFGSGFISYKIIDKKEL